MLDGDTLSTALAGQQQQQSGSGWLEWHYYTSPTFPQLCCLRLLQCQHWMMALLSTLRRGCFKQISPFKSHIQMGELFLTFFHLCLACIHHKFEKKKTFFSSSNVLSLVGKSLSCSLQRSSMRRKFQLKFAQNSFLNFKRLDWWIFTHCREVRFILGLWGNMKQRYSHSVLIETSIQYDYINYHLAPGKDYWLCSDIFAFKMNNTLSVIKGLQESLQNLQCRSTVWIPNPLLKYQYYSHMLTLR